MFQDAKHVPKVGLTDNKSPSKPPNVCDMILTFLVLLDPLAVASLITKRSAYTGDVALLNLQYAVTTTSIVALLINLFVISKVELANS